ncbi:hypothetical protein R3W88_027341 [Solanum pinnatisectum]|uniref:Uncharacterized protein n=1 Tax=Solanum pinnatisectum TaxID=50273 RepID=A0AAV9LGZ6_9SOLN|nr:hypothetical protein R3W88_027341 [Solanum pinnatisectum]
MAEELVLPILCVSPLRRMFLRAWPIFSSFINKFRYLASMPNLGPFVGYYDICWLLFSYIPWLCISHALLNLIVHDFDIVMFIIILGLYVTHNIVIHFVKHWHRDMALRLMGAKAKFMIEVIPVITLATLYHVLEFNYGYLCLLLGLTTYFYTFAYFIHVAYDVGAKDVLTGLVIIKS